MKDPAALRSGVLAWVERREVEKRRMKQNTAHGFRVCKNIIQYYYVEMVKKMRTFPLIILSGMCSKQHTHLLFCT